MQEPRSPDVRGQVVSVSIKDVSNLSGQSEPSERAKESETLRPRGVGDENSGQFLRTVGDISPDSRRHRRESDSRSCLRTPRPRRWSLESGVRHLGTLYLSGVTHLTSKKGRVLKRSTLQGRSTDTVRHSYHPRFSACGCN